MMHFPLNSFFVVKQSSKSKTMLYFCTIPVPQKQLGRDRDFLHQQDLVDSEVRIEDRRFAIN